MILKKAREMGSEIRILVLEDLSSDAELVQREIKSVGIEFISLIVNTKKDFESALINFNPDIILSDYLLPEFDGMKALKLAKEFNPSIPFILVTGSMNEETAVECMKAGADDYIIKEHMGRIGSAIKDALEKKSLRTENKNSEIKLRRSEELFRLIAENITDMIVVLDLEGKRIYNSPSYKRILGDTILLIGTDSFRDIYYEDRERIRKIFFETIQTTTGKRAEYRLMGKDGKIYFIESQGSVIVDEKGVVKNVVVVSRDITQRKMVEESLSKEQYLLSTLMDNVPDNIYFKDTESRFIRINKALTRQFNLNNPDQVIGKTDFDFFTQDHAGPAYQNEQEIIRTGRPIINLEEKETWPDGRVTWVSSTKIPLRDNDGKIIGTFGISRDITSHKKTEQALKESEERYRFIVEATFDVIYQIKYKSTKYEYINPTIEKLTGYSPDEINSIGFHSIIEKVKKLTDEKSSAIRGRDKIEKDEWRTDYQVRTKSGNLIWISDTSYPWINENGETIGRIGIMRDITDRIQAQEEIIKAKEKAEEMNRLKSNFLANMSHELRTPLIGIIGFADLLKEESKGKEEKEMVETILESGNRLSETLNLILDLSKVEAETITMNLEEIELNSIIQNQVNSFKKSLRKKDVKLKLKLPAESIYSNLDKVLFNSILGNLLNNAFKYTSRGEVLVSLKKITGDNGELAEISVKDTGIGIAKENLDIIFEPFRQVSEGYTRQFEGTGLGLTLVRKYVKSMNGEIKVESELDKGSVFLIRFPVMKTTKEKKIIEIDKWDEGKLLEKPGYQLPLLLYAEDDLNTRTVIKKYVDNYCNIDCVSNGKEAIEFARIKKYDLILMDINLGRGLNGLEAVSDIRKIPGYRDIPIVAVTAYALAGDKEKFLEKGCSHYISKPFIKEQLISLLNEILNLQIKVEV
jgi:PAS domain S-box-containing protein